MFVIKPPAIARPMDTNVGCTVNNGCQPQQSQQPN
jgi:hypothetical protein